MSVSKPVVNRLAEHLINPLLECIQGFAGSAGIVISRAIVRDLFSGITLLEEEKGYMERKKDHLRRMVFILVLPQYILDANRSCSSL
jgi:hypothetical protein